MTHGTLPWRATQKARRTLFFKYTQHGKPHGDNCAFYDLSDPRLTPRQRLILEGGAWGRNGRQIHTQRLQQLEVLRREQRERTGQNNTPRL